MREEQASKQASKQASWVSAYALTDDYAAEAAHFVRRDSRLVQDVSGRSFF
jgi:hypothetical protein